MVDGISAFLNNNEIFIPSDELEIIVSRQIMNSRNDKLSAKSNRLNVSFRPSSNSAPLVLFCSLIRFFFASCERLVCL